MNLFADMGAQPQTLQSGLVPATAHERHGHTDLHDHVAVNGRQVLANSTVTITGTAQDAGGGSVAGVEVSVDGGSTWRHATGPQRLDLQLVDRQPANRGPEEPRRRRQRQPRDAVERGVGDGQQ